ncbi:hypothetical protein [Breznakiella homolactica]|uniref:Uncharacterized protein n=1 Tax=Breznakiella homolactica TaxID=2798577 RepID=A0A7T7XJI1_9SPIR|nr:hypothetical protein [Breznakiella homolactica]QQO07560.1 hypothetical protein JFL75_11435 [Breznakiella homolactica]
MKEAGIPGMIDFLKSRSYRETDFSSLDGYVPLYLRFDIDECIWREIITPYTREKTPEERIREKIQPDFQVYLEGIYLHIGPQNQSNGLIPVKFDLARKISVLASSYSFRTFFTELAEAAAADMVFINTYETIIIYYKGFYLNTKMDVFTNSTPEYLDKQVVENLFFDIAKCVKDLL